MALTHLLIATASRSQKQTVAELNNVAVVLPEGVTLSKACTVRNPVGIPIPNAAPSVVGTGAAGSVTGTVYYAAVFVDSTTGTNGAPTSVVGVTVTDKQVSLSFTPITNEGSNTRVNAMDIYRTLSSGTVLFWLARTSHTATRFVDRKSDAFISANDTLKVFNQAHRQLPQNTYAGILEHMERLFVYGDPNFPGDRSTSPAARWRGVATTLSSAAPGTPALSAAQQLSFAGSASVRARGLRPGTVIYEGKGNQIRWCEKDNADAWPTDNIADVGGPEPIRSGATMGKDIYWFKRNEIHRHSYGADPDKNTGDGSIYDMEVNRGACTIKSVVNVDGSLFVMDPKGWYQYRGEQSIFELGESIKPILDRINWQHEAQISGSYDEKRVYWAFPLDGDTECRHVMVLDRLAFESGRGVRWWLWFVPQGIRDMSSGYLGEDADSIAFGLAGKRVCAIITTAGFEYFFADVYTDGVHPDLTNSGKTTGSASSLTLTMSGATFKSGNNDVLGAYARFIRDELPNQLQIASCTTTTFTLATGAGFNIPVGTSFVIGGIGAYWKSRQFAVDGPHDLKTPFGLSIEYLPLGKNSTMKVWGAGDRLAPVINYESDTQTGYRMASNEAAVIVDMGGKFNSHGRTGFVEIPLHAADYGYLQISVGVSNVNSPFFLSGFAVTEQARKTNR
jgi:hypothetical protein